MLISSVEAERRLNSNKNLINSLGLSAPLRVAPTPKREVTPPLKDTALRVVAGTEAHFKSAKTVAEELGITEQQVRSAKNSEDSAIRSRIERSVESVQELALLRTLESLDLLSKENIEGEKPKDVASIAASMSKVYANVGRKETTNVNNGVQFVVYSPPLKEINHFDVIEASVG